MDGHGRADWLHSLPGLIWATVIVGEWVRAILIFYNAPSAMAGYGLLMHFLSSSCFGIVTVDLYDNY